jgi:hypothetical protein
VTARAVQDGAERALYFTAKYLGKDSGGSLEFNTEFDDLTMDAPTMTAWANLATSLQLPAKVVLEAPIGYFGGADSTTTNGGGDAAKKPLVSINSVTAADLDAAGFGAQQLTEKACSPVVCPFHRATRARPWAISSISMSRGEGSRRSRRRPDSMRCQARGGLGAARFTSGLRGRTCPTGAPGLEKDQ